MKKSLLLCLTPLLVTGGALGLALYRYGLNVYVLLAALIFSGVTLTACSLLLYRNIAKFQRTSAYFAQNALFTGALQEDNMPVCLHDAKGALLWGNQAFKKLCPKGELGSVIQGFDPALQKPVDEVLIKDAAYTVPALPCDEERSVFLRYWLDRTELRQAYLQLRASQTSIMLIQLDNYDELSGSRDAVSLPEADAMIVKTVNEAGGVVRRFDSGKYLAVIAAEDLSTLLRQHFPLIDSVRTIKTPSTIPFTISAAVGKAPDLQEAYKAAQSALELALGRGGDQAVIKEGVQYTFLGGNRRSAERHSKIKSRVVARSFSNLVSQYTRVLVMGHKAADMDCLGAAIGVAKLVRASGVRVNVVLDKPGDMIQDFYDDIKQRQEYPGLFIREDEALLLCSERALCVLLDTQRPDMAVSKRVLEACGGKVVIDHHRRATDAIIDATLQYAEPSASSTCELVTELAQYYVPEAELTQYECTLLMAGIMLDTHNFTQNTGSRTFDAAAFLKKGGADAQYINIRFQDSLEEFRARSAIAQSAAITENGIAIAEARRPCEKVTAAKAADLLSGMKGINAAFVLYEDGDGISVSARSQGMVSVQLICEKLGGGGHMNMSGAQLAGSMPAARRRLDEAIEQYFKEEAEK